MDRIEDETIKILDQADGGLGFGLNLAEFIAEIIIGSAAPVGEVVEFVGDLATITSAVLRAGMTEDLKDEMACIGFCIMRNLNTTTMTDEILNEWFRLTLLEYSPLETGFYLRGVASLKDHQWLFQKYSLGLNDCSDDWKVLCECPPELPDSPIHFENLLEGIGSYVRGISLIAGVNPQAFDWGWSIGSWSGGWPSVESISGGRPFSADIVHDPAQPYVTSITLRLSPRSTNLHDAWPWGPPPAGDYQAIPVMRIRGRNWGADTNATAVVVQDGTDWLVTYTSPQTQEFTAKYITFAGKGNQHIQEQMYRGRISIAAYGVLGS